MNTEGFRHFKFYSDSYLKKMTKDELISYIHTLYKAWSVCDEYLFKARKLIDELMKEEKFDD